MESGKAKTPRLLGVAPSPSLRAVLGELGGSCGMVVDLCANLAEARDRMRSESYDLVITAGELPDGSHLNVLASVRAQSGMALAPVLLLVAGHNEEAVRAALDKGITEVFFKRDLEDLAHYLENFSVVVPARKDKLGALRALVVEGDEALRAYYKKLLSQHGLVADQVPSGEAALWEVARKNYDFILVDLVLSGSCSGMQFLRRLRQQASASARAVALAMSGYPDDARRLEALRAGANAFIAKPIDELELEAHIKGMTQRLISLATAQDKVGKMPNLQACTRCQPCQLTPRESSICMLIAVGYSDKRIAEEMGVSYWTVRTHIAHAFKKCQAGNRVELIRRLQGS